jgi:hypothetical protein
MKMTRRRKRHRLRRRLALDDIFDGRTLDWIHRHSNQSQQK